MTVLTRPLFFLVLLLPAACREPDPSTRRSQSAPPVREGYVEAGDGVRLFYRLVGAGRDTLVVIHGGPGFNMEYFARDLTPLAANHTLLFYDQRGSGRSTLVSDSAALTGERFADDLEAIRTHFGLERLNLLAHSWGPGVVALYAPRYEARLGRLLILDPVPLRFRQLAEAFGKLDSSRPADERERMEKWMNARRADPGNATACHEYYALWFRPFFADPSVMSRSKGDFCAGTAEARRNKILSVDRFLLASLGDWDWRASVRGVTAPTLIIHGTVDPLPLAGAREWAATLPNARLLLLEDIGHFPYLEAPEPFFNAADAFLRGSWPEGAEVVAPSREQQ
jgi:proline iminopeptidase